jgi:hypothetical protein
MMHRLREAMRPAKYPRPLGGLEKTVEVDETFVGGKRGGPGCLRNKSASLSRTSAGVMLPCGVAAG